MPKTEAEWADALQDAFHAGYDAATGSWDVYTAFAMWQEEQDD